MNIHGAFEELVFGELKKRIGDAAVDMLSDDAHDYFMLEMEFSDTICHVSICEASWVHEIRTPEHESSKLYKSLPIVATVDIADPGAAEHVANAVRLYLQTSSHKKELSQNPK